MTMTSAEQTISEFLSGGTDRPEAVFDPEGVLSIYREFKPSVEPAVSYEEILAKCLAEAPAPPTLVGIMGSWGSEPLPQLEETEQTS